MERRCKEERPKAAEDIILSVIREIDVGNDLLKASSSSRQLNSESFEGSASTSQVLITNSELCLRRQWSGVEWSGVVRQRVREENRVLSVCIDTTCHCVGV